ncbi:uncharacterized protein LOC144125010 [Amblyomma americanum]
MSQGATGNTERDSYDAVGLDPQASARSRDPQASVTPSDKTGKPENAANRLSSAVRPPFRRRGFAHRRTDKQPSSNTSQATIVCKFFAKNGHCRNGDKCRYLHQLDERPAAVTHEADKPNGDVTPNGSANEPSERPPAKELCRFFERHGYCRYGRGCRYAHRRRRGTIESSAQAQQEAPLNNSPHPEENSSEVGNPSASDQTPSEVVNKPPAVGSAQQPPSEEELLEQLRHREIDQFQKRFRKSKKITAEDGTDKYSFVFGPTDPDWPFDVKELTMMVAFPKSYPKECFMMSVLDEEGVLPPTLLRDLNKAVRTWLKEKHSATNHIGPGSLLLRPFLRWFDRNLEDMFIESLRKVKKVQLAEAAGLEFVPFEQLAGATKESTEPLTDGALSKGSEGLASHAADTQDDACQDLSLEPGLTDKLHMLVLNTTEEGGRSSDGNYSREQDLEHEKRTGGSASITNGLNCSVNGDGEFCGSREAGKSSEEKAKGLKRGKIERQQNGSSDEQHQLSGTATLLTDASSSSGKLLVDEKPSQRSGVDVTVNQKKGTEVKFRRLELGEGVATLECTKVAVRVQCGRCRCNADVVTPARRRNVVTCGRCSRTCSVTFRPNLMHQFNSVLGYLDLADCYAVDLVLSGCAFAIDCFSCNKKMTVDGIHYGQRRSLWCQFCNAKMAVLMESVKFLQLQPSKAAENSGTAFSIKAPKMVKNVKDPAIQEGKPLPDGGICKHYKKSFRWLRFPCCGKAYPCDKCHEEQEGGTHEMKFATRMICGHCCKEQPFAAEKPCIGCASFMTKKPTAHWEGGRGCRDRIRMSRDDNKKFSGASKTVSRKAQDKISGKK